MSTIVVRSQRLNICKGSPLPENWLGLAMLLYKAARGPAELCSRPRDIVDRRLTGVLGPHLRINQCGYCGWRHNPTERLSTLYALRDRRGPKGNADLETRHSAGERHHHGRSQEPRYAHWASPASCNITEWIRLGQHGTYTSAYCLQVQITRLSSVNVYIFQGSLMSTETRPLLHLSVDNRVMYTFLPPYAKLCRSHHES